MSATRAGDIDKVLSLMTDDVVFLVAGQSPFGKQEFAAALRAPAGLPMPQIDGRSEIQEIRVCGDWAYMWTRLSVEVTPAAGGGRSTKRAGHTLSILRKAMAVGCWRVTPTCSRRSTRGRSHAVQRQLPLRQGGVRGRG